MPLGVSLASLKVRCAETDVQESIPLTRVSQAICALKMLLRQHLGGDHDVLAACLLGQSDELRRLACSVHLRA